ncbi:olfactory receptor 52D1-like [Lepisosteus oculatus]|uniref:olfactory receptor 52D1-like n=1 Tax=Lepisosteus oculatus TaxID=7918 RepID=UPI003720F54B
MENSSHNTSFILSAYGEIGRIRYFCFTMTLVLYVGIIVANSLLIAVISVERTLHEPMYFFLCALSANELYGSTALFPSLLVNILSDFHDISKLNCFVQIFCLHSYVSIEFSDLALMSYDRYVSICYPLHYNRIMTLNKACGFLIFIWLFSMVRFGITLSLTVRLPLCGNIIEKVYCDNYSLVKLACTDTTVNNIYGLFSTFFSIGLPLLLIFYSYAKILKICLNSPRQSQIKAFNTCSTHLVSLVNFSIGCLFETIQNRFNMSHIPNEVRVALSLYFLICPPFLNPVIYGVRITKIRATFKKFLCMRKCAPQSDSTTI